MTEEFWERRAQHQRRMARIHMIQLALVLVLLAIHIYRAIFR